MATDRKEMSWYLGLGEAQEEGGPVPGRMGLSGREDS